MKNAKPIEAGCLAILLIPGKYGIFLTVVDKLPPEPNYLDCWIVDPEVEGYEGIRERYLLRIDDPGLQKEIEQEKQLVTTD